MNPQHPETDRKGVSEQLRQERVTLWRPLMPATGKSYNDRWYQPLDSDHERTLREYPKYYEVRTFTPADEQGEALAAKLEWAQGELAAIGSGYDKGVDGATMAYERASRAAAMLGLPTPATTPEPREEGDADDSAAVRAPDVTEGPSLYCDKCGERREPEDAEYVCRKGGRSLP